MKSINPGLQLPVILPAVIIDALAFGVVLFTPAIAHLAGFPVYMLEPMRLMLILSIAHASKRNSFLLALALPLFSFLVSGHPMLLKMIIITGELVFNVALFYWFVKKFSNPFFAMLAAIVVSKVACYLVYWPVFSWAFVVGEAAPAFILVQVITTLIFSAYLFSIRKIKNR
jgi:hypothetical protein